MTADSNGGAREPAEEVRQRIAGNAPGMPTSEQVLAAMKCPAAAIDRFMVPTGYQVDETGVRKVTPITDKDGNASEKVDHVASSPCLVIGVLRDDQGEELVELTWYHGRRWERRGVPRSIVKSGRRLVTHLGGAGFPVMDSSARKIEAWLDLVESYNRDVMPVTRIARRLGWQSDGVFVTGPDRPYAVHPLNAGLDQVVEAHKPAGKLADWQQVAELAADHPIAVMAVYASLAAPLLTPLHLTSFTVDLCGSTTTGKTTAAELGLSAWADPSPTGAIAVWNGTRVGLERRLALVNGLPVVIDETSLNQHADDVRDMLYAIPQGREKARGSLDGMRPTLTWQTVAITTGERPILSFTRDGGTSGRVLTLEGSPFGDDGGPTAVKVREGCYEHHGTAGPAFVEALQRIIATPEGLAGLRDHHARMTTRFQTGGSLQRRRAPLVAALYVAATVAHDAGILTFKPPELSVWDQLYSCIDPRDDRPGEALQVVRNFIGSNPHRILGIAETRFDEPDGDDPNKPPHQGWAGKLMADGAVAMNPEEVRLLLDRHGYALDAVKHVWADRGVIRRQGEHLARRVRVGNVMVRWLMFERPDYSGVEVDE